MAERAAQITYPMSILDDRDRNELFARISETKTELKNDVANLDGKVESYKAEHEQDVETINQSIADNVETLNQTIADTQATLQQNIESNTADIEDNTNRIYANEIDIDEIEANIDDIETNIDEIETKINSGAGMELDYGDNLLTLKASDGTSLSSVTIQAGGGQVAFEDDSAGNVEIINVEVSASDETQGDVKLSDAINSDSDVTGGIAATPLAVKTAITESGSYTDGKITEANAYTDEAISYVEEKVNGVQIENGQDLDGLTEIGLYYTTVSQGEEYSVVNYPPSFGTGTFILEVFPAGSSGQIIQRATYCVKGEPIGSQRVYYQGAWGGWDDDNIDTTYLLRRSDESDTYYIAQRMDTGTTVKFGIGIGGINHGVYSTTQTNWLVRGNETDLYLGSTHGEFKPYYSAGDSFSQSMRTSGYVTTDSTEVNFSIPLCKPVVGVSKVDVEITGMTLRQDGNYTHGSTSSSQTTPNFVSASISGGVINVNVIFSDTTNVVNNDAIGINLSCTITFS